MCRHFHVPVSEVDSGGSARRTRGQCQCDCHGQSGTRALLANLNGSDSEPCHSPYLPMAATVTRSLRLARACLSSPRSSLMAPVLVLARTVRTYHIMMVLAGPGGAVPSTCLPVSGRGRHGHGTWPLATSSSRFQVRGPSPVTVMARVPVPVAHRGRVGVDSSLCVCDHAH